MEGECDHWKFLFHMNVTRCEIGFVFFFFFLTLLPWLQLFVSSNTRVSLSHATTKNQCHLSQRLVS